MNSFNFQDNYGIAIVTMGTLGSNSIIGFISREMIEKEKFHLEKGRWTFPEKLIIICEEDVRGVGDAELEQEYVKINFNIDVVVKSKDSIQRRGFIHIEDHVTWRE